MQPKDWLKERKSERKTSGFHFAQEEKRQWDKNWRVVDFVDFDAVNVTALSRQKLKIIYILWWSVSRNEKCKKNVKTLCNKCFRNSIFILTPWRHSDSPQITVLKQLISWKDFILSSSCKSLTPLQSTQSSEPFFDHIARAAVRVVNQQKQQRFAKHAVMRVFQLSFRVNARVSSG